MLLCHFGDTPCISLSLSRSHTISLLSPRHLTSLSHYRFLTHIHLLQKEQKADPKATKAEESKEKKKKKAKIVNKAEEASKAPSQSLFDQLKWEETIKQVLKKVSECFRNNFVGVMVVVEE